MPGSPACGHSGPRGNVAFPRVTCGSEGGGQPRAAVAGYSAHSRPQVSGGQRPSPTPPAPPAPSSLPARTLPASGSARLSSLPQEGEGGRAAVPRPLTFGRRSGLLPAAAKRHVTPRREGKASVVAANAVAPPFPLLRSSHLQAIAFQQVTLLH